MMRFGLAVGVSFFLVSCAYSPLLPSHERSFEDFIPRDEVEVPPSLPKKEASFAADHFPSECEWHPYVRTVDGDTIVIETKTKVRFVGIDTPETKHPDKPVQPFGPEASSLTESLLLGSEKACLITDEFSSPFDKYGRRLGYVFTEQGIDVNAELLKQGLAKGYYRFDFEREAEFRAYEQWAKEQSVGMWAK